MLPLVWGLVQKLGLLVAGATVFVAGLAELLSLVVNERIVRGATYMALGLGLVAADLIAKKAKRQWVTREAEKAVLGAAPIVTSVPPIQREIARQTSEGIRVG